MFMKYEKCNLIFRSIFFFEYGQKNLGRGTLGVGSSDLLK